MTVFKYQPINPLTSDYKNGLSLGSEYHFLTKFSGFFLGDLAMMHTNFEDDSRSNLTILKF